MNITFLRALCNALRSLEEITRKENNGVLKIYFILKCKVLLLSFLKENLEIENVFSGEVQEKLFYCFRKSV